MYKTYQEAFDLTIDKLVAQNEYGYDYANKLCCYRTRDNNCCAVGINLSDETLTRIGSKQSSSLNNVWDIVVDDVRISGDPHEDLNFWCHMQTVHDRYALCLEKATESLRRLQENYGINTGKEILLADLGKNKCERNEENVQDLSGSI